MHHAGSIYDRINYQLSSATVKSSFVAKLILCDVEILALLSHKIGALPFLGLVEPFSPARLAAQS
jgi:hypothetical protein